MRYKAEYDHNAKPIPCYRLRDLETGLLVTRRGYDPAAFRNIVDADAWAKFLESGNSTKSKVAS